MNSPAISILTSVAVGIRGIPRFEDRETWGTRRLGGYTPKTWATRQRVGRASANVHDGSQVVVVCIDLPFSRSERCAGPGHSAHLTTQLSDTSCRLQADSLYNHTA